MHDAEEVVDLLIDRLIDQDNPSDPDTLLDQLQSRLNLEVIVVLKQRADNELLRNAQRALQIADIAVHAASLFESPEAIPLALWARGNALHFLSHYHEALDCYQQAEACYTTQGQQCNLATLQVNQVAVLQEMGDFRGALALARQARATCEALGESAHADLAALEANIGLVCQWMGNLQAALEAYERGQKLFFAIGDMVQVARMDINRANVLEEQDKFAAAETLFINARTTLQQAGQDQEVSRCDLNLGILAYRRGHYQLALRYLESAYRSFKAIPIPGEVAVVNLYRSFVYRALNLLHETITLAADAEHTFQKENIRWQQALALINQGIGYQRLGVHDMAEQFLLAARHILQQQNAYTRILMLDVERAFLALETGHITTAQNLAHQIEPLLEPADSPTLTARLHILLAYCALHISPPVSEIARQRAESALTIARTHHLSDIIIASYHLLGQIEEYSTAPDRALHHYQTAIETIEQVRASLLLDEFQIGFMENKLQIYEDAMRLCQRTASPTQVLYTLNLAYNAPIINVVLASGLVSPSGLHALESDTTYHDILARLNELRETWHWYQSKLEGPGNLDVDTSVERSPGSADAMRKRLQELEAEMIDLNHRWRVHTTGLPEMGIASMEPCHLFGDSIAEQFQERIQQRLQPHDVLLHYIAIEGQLHALIVTHTTISLISKLATAAPLQRLMRSWRFHLENLHLHHDTPQANLDIAQTHMAHLYAALIAPIEQHLDACQRIFLVVPPGWHDLPLAACFDGHRYLIERFELTYLSTPEILLTDIPHHYDKPNALIIGYSDQGRLTQAIIEARQVAMLLTPFFNTHVLLEDDATIHNLRSAIPNIHLLHFATHATFRQDNPLFSWIRLSDARLTVADLYEVTLPQRPLVTLSACDTGRGQDRGGGLLGMGRSFLAAGTSGLIVGLWKVDDHAAARLMADMYTPTTLTHILSAPSAALRHAQQRALAHNPHPFYWAGFIFIQG